MTIRLVWEENNLGEDGHRVYRSTATIDPNALPSPLAVLGPDVAEYEDATVEADTEYFYRVSAFKGSLEKVSDEVSITPPGAGTGIPANGLLAHFTMNNISGSTLVDESVNGNDGTIYGATAGAGYLDFDGTNDRVDIPSINVVRQSLAYFADISPDIIGDDDSIVDDVDGWGAAFFRFKSGSIYFYLWDGAAYRTMTYAVTAGNRYKIVAQHDSVTGSELWVNGTLVASDYTPLTIVYEGLESGRRLCANYALASGRFYNGKFWKYAEYDRLLTPTEIAEHFS